MKRYYEFINENINEQTDDVLEFFDTHFVKNIIEENKLTAAKQNEFFHPLMDDSIMDIGSNTNLKYESPADDKLLQQKLYLKLDDIESESESMEQLVSNNENRGKIFQLLDTCLKRYCAANDFSLKNILYNVKYPQPKKGEINLHITLEKPIPGYKQAKDEFNENPPGKLATAWKKAKKFFYERGVKDGDIDAYPEWKQEDKIMIGLLSPYEIMTPGYVDKKSGELVLNSDWLAIINKYRRDVENEIVADV